MASLVTFGLLSTVHAQPGDRPHPRLWLDGETLAQLEARALDPASQVSRAIARCDDAVAHPGAFENYDGGDRGANFASLLGACAIAWKVTGDADHGEAAVRYFEALLDDDLGIGFGDGGDEVVQLDEGYPMRHFGAYAAIGYDWLHDAPGVDETLRAHARARFKAWTEWYAAEGHRAHSPGTHYHAGYVFATTLIAIAEAGEAGADGDALWMTVTGPMWQEMSAARDGGVLQGGDWLEGWQVGALAVAEYALAARALAENGAPQGSFDAWPEAVLSRFRHSMTPTGSGLFIAGDYEGADVNQPPPPLLLQAILGGHTSDAVRAHARAELAELPADESDRHLFAALAEGSEGPATPFDAEDPTWSVAEGSRTLFARTSWDADAVWLVVQCSPQRDVDHQHLKAGNFVLTRGADDLIVDPSPYGSRSSFSSNAPTTPSSSLPAGHSPGQGEWGGDAVGFAWARQTAEKTVAARCEYADQFAGDGVPSDVLYASRDFVMWPTSKGAVLVVLDRMSTGDPERLLHTRFITSGPLDLNIPGATLSGARGDSFLSMESAVRSTGAPAGGYVLVDDCYGPSYPGYCTYGRYGGHKMTVDVNAEGAAVSLTVLDATEYQDRTLAPAEVVDGQVRITRGGETFVFAYAERPDEVITSLDVPAGVKLVVVDAPRGAEGRTDVSVSTVAGGCRVTMSARSGAEGGSSGSPLIVRVADDCRASEDPVEPTMLPDAGPDGPTPPGEMGDGGGCRTSGGAGGGLLFVTGLLALLILRRRRA